MITKYLTMQTQRLEEIGQRKQTQQQKEKLEQERLQNLQELRKSMPVEDGQTAAYHQQRMVMMSHLTDMIDDQKQKIEIAQTDHLMEQQALLSQYRKVKSFELLQNKERAEQDRKERRDEQRETDDWVSRAHRK